MTTNTYQDLVNSLSGSRVEAEEAFILAVLEEIVRCMDGEGVTRAELARCIGTSRANITQILRGRNVGIRTLAAIAHALGRTPKFEMTNSPERGEE